MSNKKSLSVLQILYYNVWQTHGTHSRILPTSVGKFETIQGEFVAYQKEAEQESGKQEVGSEG